MLVSRNRGRTSKNEHLLFYLLDVVEVNDFVEEKSEMGRHAIIPPLLSEI